MKIILIVGPTGIGKTKLSIHLAKKYNAEIINTDRMAMYKETNIGTAKITKDQEEGIVHHLINNISLCDNYTIYNFQREARKILNKLIKENKNVIIVGGSGLYIKSFLYDYELTKESKVIDNYDNVTNEELKIIADHIGENNIHQNNRNRLLRFIDSYKSSGKIIKNTLGKDKPLYDFITIGLTTDRKTLYNRINNRVDVMIEEGLLEEAKNLYERHYTNLDKIIGYKELLPFFESNISLIEAIENIKKDTRHYAKRQYTWYLNQMNNIMWFNVNFDNFDETLKEVINFIN